MGDVYNTAAALSDTTNELADKELFKLVTGNEPGDVTGYEELWGKYSNATTLDRIHDLCEYFHITTNQFTNFLVWLRRKKETNE